MNLFAIGILTILTFQIGPVSTSWSAHLAPNCLNGGPPLPLTGQKIALVEPVFTSTPYLLYSQGSGFYSFYVKYASAANVTTDLSWLKFPVQETWGTADAFLSFIQTEGERCGLKLGANVSTLSDVDVHNGLLFTANNRVYDSIILGHEEYVTTQEYGQFQKFVASGGRLIEMGSNTFYAQVSYSSPYETLVVGHGWKFNGTSAWKTTFQPFAEENAGWFGIAPFGACTFGCWDNTKNGAVVNRSNSVGADLYASYGDMVFTGYSPHEENRISDHLSTSLVATFSPQVASYVRQYRNGFIVCLCIFGDDVISGDESVGYFLVLGLTADLSLKGVQPPTPKSLWWSWWCDNGMMKCLWYRMF